MCLRHVSGAGRDLVERYPEGLDDLSLDLSSSQNEAGGKSGKTFVLMAMNMKEADSSVKLHCLWNMKKLILSTAFDKMDPVVAVNIIEKASPQALFTCSKCLGERIIHVHMPMSSRSGNVGDQSVYTPTFLPSGNRQRNAGKSSHVVHKHMPQFQWHPDSSHGSD